MNGTIAIAVWTAATAITLCGTYFLLTFDPEDDEATAKKAVEYVMFVIGLTILTPTLWYNFGYKITGNPASPFADPQAVADMQGISHQEKVLLVKSILSKHSSGGEVKVIKIWHDVYGKFCEAADNDLEKLKQRDARAYKAKLKLYEEDKRAVLSCVRFKAKVYPKLRAIRPTTYIGIVKMNKERVESITEYDPATHTDFRS